MRIAAISVMQPWARLIATGAKPIEFRSRPRHYRGPLLIHASRMLPRADWPDGIPCQGVAYPTGVAVCIVRMTDCRYLPDRDGFGWYLEDPVAIPRFPMKGNLFIFGAELPDEIFAELPRELQHAVAAAESTVPAVRPGQRRARPKSKQPSV